MEPMNEYADGDTILEAPTEITFYERHGVRTYRRTDQITTPTPPQQFPPALPEDACAGDRRRFFAAVAAISDRLTPYAITNDDIRAYYAKRFDRERMRHCSQREWAIASAEVQALQSSKALFDNFVKQVKGE